MKDSNRGGDRRVLDFSMACERAEPQLPVGVVDTVQPGNEIDIDQRRRPRHAHLHQRNQALAPGDDTRLFAELLEQLHGFF